MRVFCLLVGTREPGTCAFRQPTRPVSCFGNGRRRAERRRNGSQCLHARHCVPRPRSMYIRLGPAMVTLEKHHILAQTLIPHLLVKAIATSGFGERQGTRTARSVPSIQRTVSMPLKPQPTRPLIRSTAQDARTSGRCACISFGEVSVGRFGVGLWREPIIWRGTRCPYLPGL